MRSLLASLAILLFCAGVSAAATCNISLNCAIVTDSPAFLGKLTGNPSTGVTLWHYTPLGGGVFRVARTVSTSCVADALGIVVSFPADDQNDYGPEVIPMVKSAAAGVDMFFTSSYGLVCR